MAGCASGPSEGESPSAWSFTDIDGVAQPPAGESNTSVLFFMATWCGSCRATAPMLDQVEADYADRGVRFYSIGTDPSETPAQLRAWQETHGHAWPHGIDEGLQLQRAFGVTSQSSVVVLDADGKVARAWGYGQVREAPLRETLDAALA